MTASLLFSAAPHGVWEWILSGTRLLAVLLALFLLAVSFSSERNDEKKLGWSWSGWAMRLAVGLVLCCVMAAAIFGWPSDWPGWVCYGLRAIAAVEVVCLAATAIPAQWNFAGRYGYGGIVAGVTGFLALVLMLALISGKWIYLAGVPVSFAAMVLCSRWAKARVRRNPPDRRSVLEALRSRPFTEDEWGLREFIDGERLIKLSMEEKKLGRSLAAGEITQCLSALLRKAGSAEMESSNRVKGRAETALSGDSDDRNALWIPKAEKAWSELLSQKTADMGREATEEEMMTWRTTHRTAYAYNKNAGRDFHAWLPGPLALPDTALTLTEIPAGPVCGRLALSFRQKRQAGKVVFPVCLCHLLLEKSGAETKLRFLTDMRAFLIPEVFKEASRWEDTSFEMREGMSFSMLTRAVWMRVPDWSAPWTGMIAGQQWTLEPGERQACVTLSLCQTGDSLLCKISGLAVDPREWQRTVPAFWFLIPLEEWLKAPWLPVDSNGRD